MRLSRYDKVFIMCTVNDKYMLCHFVDLCTFGLVEVVGLKPVPLHKGVYLASVCRYYHAIVY